MSLNQDIGTAAGFSQLTSGTLNDVASALGINPADWDIREATYKGGRPTATPVKFHVFKNKGPFTNPFESTPWNGALPRISDTGGRRKVKYQYPYIDGQTTDDLGRRPASFELEIVIFGQNYMDCFNKLMVEFDDPVPGILVHPVRGEIVCGVDQFTLTHQSDQRKAMGIHVTFIEHNFSIGSIPALASQSTIKSALSAALTVFSVIDAAINKVVAAQLFIKSVQAITSSYLALFKSNSASTLAKLNVTFNKKGGSADIPALLPVNLGGISQPTTVSTPSTTVGSLAKGGAAVTAITQLSAAFGNVLPAVTTAIPPAVTTSQNFPLVASINDPYNSIPVSTLSSPTAQAVSVTQLTKEVDDLTTQVAAIIAVIESNNGALELFDTIISLRQAIVNIQAVLVAGIAASKATLNVYVTPRIMSIREVCFQNGIPLSRTEDIFNLNPSLLSVNFIDKGTMIMVPSS